MKSEPFTCEYAITKSEQYRSVNIKSTYIL